MTSSVTIVKKTNNESVGQPTLFLDKEMRDLPQVQFKLEYSLNNYETDGVTAIITAAGSSSRMGGLDKILAPLRGRPVLTYSLKAFQEHPDIKAIVVVASKSNMQAVQSLCNEFSKVTDIVSGGDSRAESVAAGFNMVRTKQVLIHDGARPLVSKEIIDRVIEGLKTNKASAAAMPVKDTIKSVDEFGMVTATLKRDGLMAMQTPQGFDSETYENALSGRTDISGFTDDCALVESSGVKVNCVAGDYKNIKITTAEDLLVAETFLKGEK